MNKKLVKKYKSLIKKKRFTEQELVSFRKLINCAQGDDLDTAYELARSFDKAGDSGISLTREQQAKGRVWLLKKTFKLNGEVRKSAPIEAFERQVLKGFKRFSCVGLYDISLSSCRNLVPIYRCEARDGSYFTYACLMFGTIKVLEVGDAQGPMARANQPCFDVFRRFEQGIKYVGAICV